MEYDLKTLVSEETPDQDVYRYVSNLVGEAKPLAHNPQMCFWGMAEPNTMPSDARVDFFYRPTYIATAFLMQAILKHPELMDPHTTVRGFGAEDVKKLSEVLPKAMKGCMGREFGGSGYDFLKGQLETMELFAKSGVMDYVKKYPDTCPEFTELFNHTLETFREDLATGRTKGPWGTDYREVYKRILQIADRAR